MLRIVFGEAEEVLYGPVWFDYNYEREWFEDEYVQRMIEEYNRIYSLEKYRGNCRSGS